MRNPALRRLIPAEFWLTLERHGAAALQLPDRSLFVFRSNSWTIDAPIYVMEEFGIQGVYILAHHRALPISISFSRGEDPYAYPPPPAKPALSLRYVYTNDGVTIREERWDGYDR